MKIHKILFIIPKHNKEFKVLLYYGIMFQLSSSWGVNRRFQENNIPSESYKTKFMYKKVTSSRFED